MASLPPPAGSPLDDAPIRPSPALLTIFAVTLTAVLGVASLAPALPAVARALRVDAHEVAWLITAFTLPGVFLAPLLGALADRWGRRAVLVPALVVFAGAGSACALAQDLPTLIALRLLQGIGAAPLGSLNITLIGDLYRGRRQIAVMGINATVLSVGTASYPLIGGLLASIEWHWVFVLPSIALIVAPFAWRCFPTAPRSSTGTVIEYLQRVRAALDLRLLALMLASLLTFVILYGSYLTYFPFLMSERLHAGPRAIGLVISSGSIATGLASLRVAAMTRRFGSRRVLWLAYAFYVASMMLASWAAHPVWLVGAAVLFGAGNGLNLPTLQSRIASTVGAEVRAGVMSLNATALRSGQTLGPLLAGLAHAIGGIEAAFAAGALTALGLALLVAIAVRDTPDVGRPATG